MNIVQIAFYAVPVIALLSIATMWFSIVSHWRRAFLSGGKVSIVEIVLTRARHCPVDLILDAYLSLINSGFKTTYASVEQHYIIHKAKIITSEDLLQLVKANLQDTRFS